MNKCIDCGADYGEPFFFLWLPDKKWLKLGYKLTDYVCAHCIIKKLAEKKITYGYMSFNDEKIGTFQDGRIKITQTYYK